MSFADYLLIKKCSYNTFSFTVQEQHLNAHGTAHGGILYGICSEVIALYVSETEKRDGVGAEGSIHYYRPAKLNDNLNIKVIPRKDGKKMSIYLLEIKNSSDQLVADAMFTVAHI